MKTGLPYGSPVFMLVILFMRELLLECRQTSIEQVDGVIRVVDTQTSILGEHSPVPEGGGFCLGIGACDYPTFCIKQAIGLQSRFKLIELILDISLRTVDVEVINIAVASCAGCCVRLKGVVVVLTQVAGYAGVAHQRVVYGGASLNVSAASDAKQHGALRTMVRTPVGAVNLGRVASHVIFKDVTDLVTVGAQVTFAAIIGLAFDFEHLDRSGCLEAPVGISVARVDVVTGTAVLASWFTTRSLHFVGALPSGDHGAEAFAGVTAGTTRTSASIIIRRTCSVPGHRPSSLLAGDQ